MLSRCGHAASGLLLCAAAQATPLHGATLVEFEASYRAEHSGMRVGKLRMRLRRDGELWQLESETDPAGVLAFFDSAHVREISVIEIVGDTWRPLTYRYEGGDADKNVSTNFDWARGELQTRRGDKSLNRTLPADAFDSLSILLAIGERLRTGATEIELSLVNKGRVRAKTYSLELQESLALAVGEVQTLRVREVRDSDKRYTMAWYAPALRFLPVKIEQYRKGKRVARLELTAIRWADGATAGASAATASTRAAQTVRDRR